MKLNRKNKEKSEISTSSLPDIIFMLLIFFMVTTVMREFEGLDVLLPRAKTIEKLESKRHTSYIWATKDGLISVDDKIVGTWRARTMARLAEMNQIEWIIEKKTSKPQYKIKEEKNQAISERDTREKGWGVESLLEQANYKIDNEDSMDSFRITVKALLERLNNHE